MAKRNNPKMVCLWQIYTDYQHKNSHPFTNGDYEDESVWVKEIRGAVEQPMSTN